MFSSRSLDHHRKAGKPGSPKMRTIPMYKGRTRFVKLLVYFGCLFFCINYLHELFDKRFRTYFEVTTYNSTYKFLSICIQLSPNPKLTEEFCENLTSTGEPYELTDEMLSGCRNYTELLTYYGDRSVEKTPKQILEKAKRLQMANSFSLEPSPEEMPSFYLNSQSLCFRYSITDVTSTNSSGIKPIKVYNNHKMTNRVFFHNALYAYNYNNHLHIQMCKPFRDCEEFQFYSTQFTYSFTKPPFGAQCIEHRKTDFEFSGLETIDHESICIQECIKATYRAADLFYSDHDDRPLNFTESILQEAVEAECDEKCSGKECCQTTYLVASKSMVTGNHTVYNGYWWAVMATETPYIGQFDFQLNLIGFVSLLFGISLNLAISNIRLLVNFKTNFRFTRVAWCTGYFILLLLNAYVFLKAYEMLGDYLSQSKVPHFTRRLFEFHDLDLHVCFPLAVVLNYSLKQPDNQTEIRERTKEILEKRKLEEMQSLSLPPEALIARIYYNYRKEKNHFDVSKPSDFAFLNSDFGLERPTYSKCFTYHIPALIEPNYRTLMRESRLVVQSKGHERFNIFLTEEHKRLTSQSRQLSMGLVELHISEWSEGEDGCVNYEKRSDLDCDSQKGCITNCVLEKFTSENGGFLPPVVVDSKNFDKYKQRRYDLSKEARKMKFEEDCGKDYVQEDCYSARYQPEPGEQWMPLLKNKWEIFPYFLIRHMKKGIKKQLLPFLVDITTMYCILIGLSYPQQVSLIYKLILERSAMFYRFHKSVGHYMRWLRRLVTLVFFFYYLRIVLNDSLNTYVESTYVKDTWTNLTFPVFGLCFKIEHKDSLNGLTGHQLQAIEHSKHITVENIFECIHYINTTNDMAEWTPNDTFDSNFEVIEMFYSTRKCLEFRYSLNVQDRALNRHNYGLLMRLNQHLNDSLQHPHYYYYSRANANSSFSRFHPMELGKLYNLHFTIEKVRYHDSFQTLKNPLRLFLPTPKIRDHIYLKKLMRDFEAKYKATTLLLPLYPESFELKVRNDLFERYVDEVSRAERYAVDYNFDVDHTIDFISTVSNRSYELSFSKRIPVVVQQTDSSCTFVNFFTNLLNLFSFWFDLSVTECLQKGLERLYMAVLKFAQWIAFLAKRRNL